MRITVPAFTGLNKRIAIQRLGDSVASEATDCDFRSGDLRGYLDDTPAGTTAYHDINGVTIFDYTPSQELIANGNWDIVRSPVVNDQFARCYYSKYPTLSVPIGPTDYPRIVDKDNFGLLNGDPAVHDSKRLGVPKPAPITMVPLPDVHSGNLFSYTVQSRPKSSQLSKYDNTVNLVDALPSGLKTGSKILLDAVGLDPGPYTVISDGTKMLSLKDTGPVTVKATKLSSSKTTNTKDANGKITGTSTVYNNGQVTWGGDFWIAFNSVDYIPNVGDQLLIEVTDNGQIASTSTVNPRGLSLFSSTAAQKFYYVIEVQSPNLIKLGDASGNAITATMPGSGQTVGNPIIQDGYGNGVDVIAPDRQLWFTKVGSAGNTIPDPTATSNSTIIRRLDYDNNKPSVLYQVYATHTVTATEKATWQDASTIDTIRTRAYLITFVNKYGDESAPSIPTDTIDVVPGSPVKFLKNFVAHSGLVLTSADPTNYPTAEYPDLVGIRLYRTDETGTFRLVDSETTLTLALLNSGTAATDVIYTDSKTDAQLGEPLTTTGWYPPPQGVTGLISAPNGVVVGFKGKTIYPSVPFVPYAYPIAYQMATDADIMGLVSTASGIAVLTKQMPYLVAGTDPSGFSMVKLEVPAACVSHQSIVDMGTFGVYAGPDGLMAINGAEVRNLTQDMLTRAQWQEYNPTTIIGGHSEGRYVGSYLSGGSRKSFIFDTLTNDFVDLSISAVGFYTDLQTDTLKFVDAAGNIKLWNRGTTTKSYFWKSKVFQLPMPSLFGAAQVVAYSYPVTFKLYDYDTGTQIGGSISVTAQNPFRLPSGARYQNLQITLGGKGSVATVAVATSIGELKEV